MLPTVSVKYFGAIANSIKFADIIISSKAHSRQSRRRNFCKIYRDLA